MEDSRWLLEIETLNAKILGLQTLIEDCCATLLSYDTIEGFDYLAYDKMVSETLGKINRVEYARKK